MGIEVSIWLSLAGMSLLSVCARRPWTAYVAAAVTPAVDVRSPYFFRANKVVTLAWVALFAVLGGVAAVTSDVASAAVAAVAVVALVAGSRKLGILAVGRMVGRDLAGGAMQDVDPGQRRELLAVAVRGRSDREVVQTALLPFGSVERLLDTVFDGMRGNLRADNARDCVLTYRLADGDTSYEYTVTISGSDLSVRRGAAADAAATFTSSVATFLRIVSGVTDPSEAYLRGDMQIDGDLALAADLARMFSE